MRPTSLALAAIGLLTALTALTSGCEDPKPPISGRMRGPSGMVMVKGCPLEQPGCNRTEEGHHLLLVTNSMGDDVRVFDADRRSFFKAVNPLFPFSIPVGPNPRAIALDPFGEWAVVVNQLSQDVSLINLAPNRLVEVDTDADLTTVAASLDCPLVPNQMTDPTTDRCLAGVSRAPIGFDQDMWPESIAVPAGLRGDPEQEAWPRDQPLPVWVSLPGTGKLAYLRLRYPANGGPQTLRYVESIEVGGMPSGLAITRDGSRVWAADEASDSVLVVDPIAWTVQRVEVGGPTRRVYLDPTEQVLYAIRLDTNRIALVDTQTLERRPAFVSESPEARDPDSDELDIGLPGIPRELTFVTGRATMVENAEFSPASYPLDQEPTDRFAFVSDLNGNVYILDALRHGNIDLQPTIGPRCGPPGYVVSGKTLTDEELWACVPSGDCPHPNIAGFDRTSGGISPVTGNTEEEPNLYFGIRVFPGQTRSEGWILTWEGILPGTDSSTGGRFADWFLDDDSAWVDFFDSGVEVGDSVVVLTAPAAAADGSGAIHPACLPDGKTDVRKEFTVTSVGERSLGLAPVAGMDLDQCWPTALRYNVRAKAAWTVQALVSGHQPRLRMVPWQDPPPDPPVYDHGLIALTMFEPGPDAQGNPVKVPRDARWGFSTEAGFHHARFTPSIQAGLSGAILAIDLDDGADQVREEDDPLYDPLVGRPADDRIYVLFEGSNAMMEFFPDALTSTNYLLYQ